MVTLFEQGRVAIDHPVYMCDLGAALSAGDSRELQEVMEEKNVSLPYYHRKGCITRRNMPQILRDGAGYTNFLSDYFETFFSEKFTV